MPKIFLKPNSPEFIDSIKSTHKKSHICDMPGCKKSGEHRAPKDRGLNEYYWFCLPHVQEYNKAWNFFAGMSPADMEDHINKSTIWDRPTRRYDSMAHENLQKKAWQAYNFTEQEPPKQEKENSSSYSYAHPSRNTPEHEAMAIMGLEPPLSPEALKERYKKLVKKYHPDHAGPNKESEDLLKKVNMAYTVLKLAYKKFETLPER